MVSISRRRVKVPSRRTRKVSYDKEKLGAVGLALIGVLYVAWSLFSATSGDSVGDSNLRSMQEQQDAHPQLHVQDPNAEAYNAIALDIIQTLNCHSLLNATKSSSGYDIQRRLEEEGGEEDVNAAAYEDQMGMGDDYNGDGGGYYLANPTGEHLFCLAALSSTSTETANWKDKIHCDATRTRQQALLDLWSEARSEISEFVLKKTLQVSIESERDLVGTSLHLWSPSQDTGVDYMLSNINDEQKNADHGGIYGLTENLGIHKLFVDVGSCLGITSMAIALLYPGTKIVSIEAASPNWLLQEMNWRCNDFSSHTRTSILSGVGPSQSGAQMAKFMWRPQATTSTRSWTPKEEHEDTDVELTVKLRPWHSLLAEAEIADKRIDVLNVDCEGTSGDLFGWDASFNADYQDCSLYFCSTFLRL